MIFWCPPDPKYRQSAIRLLLLARTSPQAHNPFILLQIKSIFPLLDQDIWQEVRGSAASGQIATASSTPNATNTTISMNKCRTDGQRGNTKKLSPEVLGEERKEHYRKARQLTAGIVFFFSGNRMLDEDVLSCPLSILARTLRT